jgi:putative hydrolase of the HAD superfamily
MFPFDVVLFDVGGVLLTNGWDTDERARAAAQFHLDLPSFEKRHHAYVDTWERGQISVQTYLDATVFNEPRNFSQYDFFGFMLDQSKLLEDSALGILKELAASNKCMVGALNNEARETNEYRFKTFGLRDYFKVSLSSCYLGLRKPDLAIYERASDILGRPAKRILFIDDRTENVVAAMKVGMKAIRYDGSADLRKELTRMGVS